MKPRISPTFGIWRAQAPAYARDGRRPSGCRWPDACAALCAAATDRAARIFHKLNYRSPARGIEPGWSGGLLRMLTQRLRVFAWCRKALRGGRVGYAAVLGPEAEELLRRSATHAIGVLCLQVIQHRGNRAAYRCGMAALGHDARRHGRRSGI